MRYTRLVTWLVAGIAVFALATDATAGHPRGHGRRVFVRPSIGFYYGGWWGGYGYPWWGPLGYYGDLGPAGVVQQNAALRLQVQPRETEVYVDGHYAGVVDDFDGTFQRLRLLPGPHTLELYLDGYRSVRQDIHAGPGHTLKIRYAMEPLAEGESAGPRPQAPEPEAGAEPAPATASAGAPRAAAPARAPPRADVREDGAFGELVLRTQPRAVEVWIDGERWPADSNGTLTLHLPAGVHRVELRRSGHDGFSTEIEIRTGEARELNVRLPHDGSSL